MSSILKALKKLEEERADRPASAPPGAGGQFVAPRHAERRPWLLLVAGICAGLLLAGGLYALLGNHPEAPSSPSIVSLEQRSTASPGPATPATVPVADKPAPRGPDKLASGHEAGALPVRQEAASRPAKIEPAKTAPAVAVPAAPVAGKSKADGPAGSIEQVEVERREIPAPGQQWSAPHLTVSDILPDSGGGRMAIVNDLPVMEGTMVDDAVVKEIHPDRVLFVIDGKSVVVPLPPR